MREAGKPSANQPESTRVCLYFQNTEVIELIRFAIEKQFECSVRGFDNAETALSSIQEKRPDLLVIDGTLQESAPLLECAQKSPCKVIIHHPQKGFIHQRNPPLVIFG